MIGSRRWSRPRIGVPASRPGPAIAAVSIGCWRVPADAVTAGGSTGKGAAGVAPTGSPAVPARGRQWRRHRRDNAARAAAARKAEQTGLASGRADVAAASGALGPACLGARDRRSRCLGRTDGGLRGGRCPNARIGGRHPAGPMRSPRVR